MELSSDRSSLSSLTDKATKKSSSAGSVTVPDKDARQGNTTQPMKHTMRRNIHETRVTFASPSDVADANDSGFSEICQDDEASMIRRRINLDEIPSEAMFKNVPMSCFSTPCKPNYFVSVSLCNEGTAEVGNALPRNTATEKRESHSLPHLNTVPGKSLSNKHCVKPDIEPCNAHPMATHVYQPYCRYSSDVSARQHEFSPGKPVQYKDAKDEHKIIGDRSPTVKTPCTPVYTPVIPRKRLAPVIPQMSLNNKARSVLYGDLNDKQIHVKQEPRISEIQSKHGLYHQGVIAQNNQGSYNSRDAVVQNTHGQSYSCDRSRSTYNSLNSLANIQIMHETHDTCDDTQAKQGIYSASDDTQRRKLKQFNAAGDTQVQNQSRNKQYTLFSPSVDYRYTTVTTQNSHNLKYKLGNTNTRIADKKDNTDFLNTFNNVLSKQITEPRNIRNTDYRELSQSLELVPSENNDLKPNAITKAPIEAVYSDISDTEETVTHVNTKLTTPSHTVAYSDISDDDGGTPVIVNARNRDLVGKPSQYTFASELLSDTGSASEGSGDEASKELHNTIETQSKKVRRKPLTPRKSAAKRDPRFKGVTVWLQTEFKNGDSHLHISACYSNVKVASPRRQPKAVPVSYRRVSPHVYSYSETTMHATHHHDRESYLSAKTCASCRTRRTPLWRDAEDGTPLCNACGIRYKKYRLRCSRCWHIPKKDIKTYPKCPICGATLRFSFHRKSW